MNKEITNFKIENLREFKCHPYKVVDDWDMVALTESIRKSGIINPVVVRPIEGSENYEIISGHRRIFAAKKAGLTEVPALIYALDKDAAIVAVVDSNFNREHILPSEKAFAYKMRNEALKRQNKDSVQVGLGDQIAMVRASESASQIKRYVRLTKLNKQLLDMVDEGKIAFTPAVELSFLNDIEQADLLEVMEVTEATPNLSQAMRLKEISQKEGLTPESISDILSELKANQRERLHIQTEKIRKFFYEDNVSGKVTDSFYMELSHKYENEKEELKKKIFNLKIQLDELNKKVFHKEMFLSAIEKFMEMKTITAPLIRELIDHIEVHETEGEGKYKTQRIVIFYRFVGYIEIPEMALNQGITKDTRQGVAVSYIPKAITA